MLRYGIMSASSIAPRFIAAVREANAGEIVGISSRTLEKAKEKAEEWLIPKAYGSHDALLEDEEINIVYISSVNSMHYPMARAALESGKHVVCEKPCTTSSEQTAELFALAREKGLFFMEAQKMLFLPTIREVSRRIEAGRIGEVRLVEFSHSFSAGYNGWLFDPSLGGGTLLSSGIYSLQLVLKLFGGIKSIGGICTREGNMGENGYVLSGETEGGVLFSVINNTSVVLENRAVVYGTSGKIVIPEYWKARGAEIIVDSGDGERLNYPCKHEMVYEAVHVKECIERGLLTSPIITEKLSVDGIRAIEEVKRIWESK